MVTPLPIETANLGMADSLILMVMALVVFGPRRLPQIGRQIGKLMYEFRKASNDFKFQMEEELRLSEDADRRKKEEEERRKREEEERMRVDALAASNPPADVAVSAGSAIEIQHAPAEISEESEPSVTEAASTPVGEDPYPPEPVPAAAEERVLPRIQAPWVGERVAANAPNSVPQPAAESASEPADQAPEPPPANPTETVSQHG